MVGDTVIVKAKAFYKSDGPKESNKQPIEDIVASAVRAIGGSAVDA
jgi:hypothetical protein